VQRLHAEIVRILKEPDVVARFDSLGVTAVGSTPEQLANVQKTDSAKWAKVIKAAGIKAESAALHRYRARGASARCSGPGAARMGQRLATHYRKHHA
jgi:hypothetical protein